MIYIQIVDSVYLYLIIMCGKRINKKVNEIKKGQTVCWK